MRVKSIFSLPADFTEAQKNERRHMLARLGLAWLVMMQCMMFAFPGYFSSLGQHDGTEAFNQVVMALNWLSLVLTIPVLLYSAMPIWKGVFSDHHHGVVNMDWPVALGILVSFVPSVANTIYPTAEGDVYYESVTMLIAFLLTARYLEFCASQATSNVEIAGFKRLDVERKRLTSHADKIAFYYVFVQILFAFVTGAVWYFWIDSSKAIYVMVSLFVMSCPCAMSMSVPTAVSAIGIVMINFPDMPAETQTKLMDKMNKVADRNLYGSFVWHILMTILSVFGVVVPWVAALTMLVSSLAVAWYSWSFSKKEMAIQIDKFKRDGVM